ncbi:GNAT family N-acetyltransferase [Halorhabdus tiamatea]|uniref:GCN5-related N-acetyltransferase n=1 Tax=Halorhabdus tiamatea SARL4B TaxID=1033806 RepID=F7PL98_9EURY|nr:GNAT family N-acetyltransferase [Halorhabdus tiamatea]CCQ34742.1 GCN5-related N-acetyltransferase [Halorhabdus tiamatea SARL4B]
MEILELIDESDREEAIPILKQLWTDRKRGEIRTWTAEDDYHLFGASEDSTLLGVAGVRIDDFLHHQRHAWLYDFVVDEPRRGEGIGRALLEHVESWAVKQDCESVALASPLDNRAVHEYYESQDFEKWGYVIETDL